MDEFPSTEPLDIPAYEAAAKAADHFGFTMRLSALVESGTLRPEMFPKVLLVPLAHGRLEIASELTAESLRMYMANAVMLAVGHSAMVMNRALEDTFGKHPLDIQDAGGRRRAAEDLGDREAAQEILFMFRSAVSHHPFRPTWQCKGNRAGVFRVTQMAIEFDARQLDGRPVEMQAIGGLEGYLRLLQYCERKIRRAAGVPDAPRHAREWLTEVNLEECVPEAATDVLFVYHVRPNGATAILYRTRDDAEPVWIRGGPREVTIRLGEAQRIYYETVGPDTRLDLSVRGYDCFPDAADPRAPKRT
jgi:hypothetical protein